MADLDALMHLVMEARDRVEFNRSWDDETRNLVRNLADATAKLAGNHLDVLDLTKQYQDLADRYDRVVTKILDFDGAQIGKYRAALQAVADALPGSPEDVRAHVLVHRLMSEVGT